VAEIADRVGSGQRRRRLGLVGSTIGHPDSPSWTGLRVLHFKRCAG
jgi:hypothetical protein